MRRSIQVAIVGWAVFASAVTPANAGEGLSLPLARARAAAFAENTCSHDKSCARSGVQGCRRLADRVVLCRIFDHRRTEAQGSFLCRRLVRLALKPRQHRVPVTGVSGWEC
jgi:hypothetical protein